MSQFGGGGSGKPGGWGRPGTGGTQLPGFGGLGGVGGFPMMSMGMPMINQSAFSQPGGMMGMGVMGSVPQQQGRISQQPPQQTATSGLASGAAASAKNRTFVGVVTKMHDSYGFIDDDVFFQHTVIRGANPRVGDKVMVEASYNPQMPFKWNAFRVQLLTGPGVDSHPPRGPSPMGMSNMQMQRGPGSGIGPNNGGGGPPGGMNSRWGPGGAQDRNGPPRSSPVPPRRRSPQRRSPPPRRNSPIRSGPPPQRRKTRTPPPRRSSPPPIRRPSPPRESRKRDRSPAVSLAPSTKRDSASPPRRRARIIPRYECRPTKPVMLSNAVSVVQLRSRYSKMYVPSDFVGLSPVWTKGIPLDTTLDICKPVSFHVYHKDVDYPNIEQADEAIHDPEDADHRYQVKVLLLAHAGKEEVLKKTFGLLPDGSTDDAHEVTSMYKHLQFLVGSRGKELIGLGGSWSPSLDGGDPMNAATLIRTAIRTTKALTGVDLTNVPQWYSMVQVRYYRAEKDRVDTVHLLWPDTQMLMPDSAQWQALQVAISAQLEQKIAAVDALSLKEEPPVEASAAVTTTATAVTPKVEGELVASDQVEMVVGTPTKAVAEDVKAADTPNVETPVAECDSDVKEKAKPQPRHWNDLDVKQLKVAELKAELEARGLETRGIKTLLAQRLQEALDKEQELEEDGPPEGEDIIMKDETGEGDDEAAAEPEVIKIEDTPAAPAKSEEDLKREAEEKQKQIEKLEKEKAEKKASLEKHYAAPKETKVLVFPSKTAKSGKFDCRVVSLQSLLEYRQDDNKESQFEVSLFAEAFKEMLERQAAFTIYQSIIFAGEKETERKKRDEAKGRGDKEKSEVQDLKEKEGEKKEDDKTEKKKEDVKVELKSTVFNRALFEACAMFDVNLCSYITERDLEEILYNGEFGINRGQVSKVAHKLCSRDRINYRNLTDNLVDADGNVKYTPGYCDGAPDVDILIRGYGLQSVYESSDSEVTTSNDGTVVINGNVINVNQKLALLKKSEQERDSAKAALSEQTSLIAQLREAKQELEKKKKDLEKDLEKTKKKLTDTSASLKSSTEDGVHLRGALADVRRYADRITSVVDKACPPPPSPKKEKSEEKDKEKKSPAAEEVEMAGETLVLSDETGPDAEVESVTKQATAAVDEKPAVSNGESKESTVASAADPASGDAPTAAAN